MFGDAQDVHAVLPRVVGLVVATRPTATTPVLAGPATACTGGGTNNVHVGGACVEFHRFYALWQECGADVRATRVPECACHPLPLDSCHFHDEFGKLPIGPYGLCTIAYIQRHCINGFEWGCGSGGEWD